MSKKSKDLKKKARSLDESLHELNIKQLIDLMIEELIEVKC